MNPVPDWLQVVSAAGGALSGLFAFAAFAVTIWTLRTALPTELAKFRQARQEEQRAEVAREVWVAAFRLLTALKGLTGPGSIHQEVEDDAELTAGERYWKRSAHHRGLVSEYANGFLDAWGLAAVYFDAEIWSALRSVWDTAATVLGHVAKHARELDGAIRGLGFGEKLQLGEDAKLISETEQRLHELLSPIARLGGPNFRRAHELVPSKESEPRLFDVHR